MGRWVRQAERGTVGVPGRPNGGQGSELQGVVTSCSLPAPFPAAEGGNQPGRCKDAESSQKTRQDNIATSFCPGVMPPKWTQKQCKIREASQFLSVPRNNKQSWTLHHPEWWCQFLQVQKHLQEEPWKE